MQRYLAILKPTGPAFAATGHALDLFVRSDTLSAAMVTALARAGKDVDAQNGWARCPPFRVSSALPVLIEQEQPSVFYPVPDALKAFEGGQAWPLKRVKRIHYADEEWLAQRAKGGVPGSGRVVLGQGDRLCVVEWRGPDRARDLAVVNPRTGLAVDRLTGGPIEDLLFEVSDILPSHPGMRLGVVLDFEDDSAKDEALGALKMTGLAGIGAKRSCGRGQFEVETVVEFRAPDLGTGAHLLLSLYHPQRKEVEDGVLDRARYRLVQRSGFVTSLGAMTLRRRRVTMLTEGSVVGPREPSGDVVEVLSPLPHLGLFHPVYRDGRALCIGIDEKVLGG